MVIGGGAENCLGAEEDTAAPWAAGEALLDGEVDAEGLGSGLSALLIWADDGGEAAGLAGAAVGAAGAALGPHAVSTSIRLISAKDKRYVKYKLLAWLERVFRYVRELYRARSRPIL
jgi:hypothetical protein